LKVKTLKFVRPVMLKSTGKPRFQHQWSQRL